jgi:hypothetical protein
MLDAGYSILESSIQFPVSSILFEMKKAGARKRDQLLYGKERIGGDL